MEIESENEKINELVSLVYSNRFAVIPDFFNESEIDTLLNIFLLHESDLTEAGIGKQKEFTKSKAIRSDKIFWIEKEKNPVLDTIFFESIDEISTSLNRRCFLGLNNYEFHFAKYEPGTFYKRHKDAFRSDDARKISVILYLNKNWKAGDGGELKIYLNDAELSVEPKAGTLVIFESDIEHEVLQSNTDRLSITGWLKNNRTLV
jgi:SM-20-related protein